MQPVWDSLTPFVDVIIILADDVNGQQVLKEVGMCDKIEDVLTLIHALLSLNNYWLVLAIGKNYLKFHLK